MALAEPSDFRVITGEIYDMLSGPAGSRDYDLVRRHYHPVVRLVRTGVPRRVNPSPGHAG